MGVRRGVECSTSPGLISHPPQAWGGAGGEVENMQIHDNKLIPLTKALRHNLTPWENKLWKRLRAKRFFDFKFKRQVMIGEYIADFCCNERKLIIELDIFNPLRSWRRVTLKGKFENRRFSRSGTIPVWSTLNETSGIGTTIFPSATITSS